MNKSCFQALALLALASFACLAPAQAQAGSRDMHRFGVTLGIIAEPFPSVWGFNLNYNALSFARITAGMGFISASSTDATTGAVSSTSITTIAGEAKLMVPNWYVSPSATIGYANLSGTISGTSSGTAGLTATGGALYAGFGLDAQTGGGFNIGLDYKFLLGNGGGGLPGIYLGFYF